MQGTQELGNVYLHYEVGLLCRMTKLIAQQGRQNILMQPTQQLRKIFCGMWSVYFTSVS